MGLIVIRVITIIIVIQKYVQKIKFTSTVDMVTIEEQINVIDVHINIVFINILVQILLK